MGAPVEVEWMNENGRGCIVSTCDWQIVVRDTKIELIISWYVTVME